MRRSLHKSTSSEEKGDATLLRSIQSDETDLDTLCSDLNEEQEISRTKKRRKGNLENLEGPIRVKPENLSSAASSSSSSLEACETENSEERSCLDPEPSLLDLKKEQDHADIFSFELYSQAYRLLADEEFNMWKTIFTTQFHDADVAKNFYRDLLADDPRLRPSFTFSARCSFLSGLPTAKIVIQGSYGSGFKVKKAQRSFMQLMETGSLADLVLERIMDLKTTMLMGPLFFKQLVADGTLNPKDFWLHFIAELPISGRSVLRGHVVRNQDSPDSFILELQNVSKFYTAILALSSL